MVLQELNQVAGNLFGGGGNGGVQGRSAFSRTLRLADFTGSDVTAPDSSKYTKIGDYTVGAQQVAEYGQGDSSLDPKEQGLVNINLRDSNDSAIDGFVKLTHESAQGTRTVVVMEERTEELRQSTRTERVVLPRASSQGHPRVREDSKLSLYFQPDSDSTTVDTTHSVVRLPATLYE